MNLPSAKAARGGVLAQVHVTPNAREDIVTCDGGVLRVRTREPADKGKANRAVLKLLKPIFGSCELSCGLTSHRKAVFIPNMGMEAFIAAREALCEGQDEKRLI